MKLKCDFVTNSSSVSYIVHAPDGEGRDELIAAVEKIGRLPIASNEGSDVEYIGNTIKELIEEIYTCVEKISPTPKPDIIYYIQADMSNITDRLLKRDNLEGLNDSLRSKNSPPYIYEGVRLIEG